MKLLAVLLIFWGAYTAYKLYKQYKSSENKFHLEDIRDLDIAGLLCGSCSFICSFSAILITYMP